MTIADRISELRHARELSQEELAEQCGVSRQAVSKWESEQSIPDMENIVALSNIFGVSTDFLLKGVEYGDELKPRRSPALPYNIVATALIIIATALSLSYAYAATDLAIVVFIFAVLGVMTFMLGTTRIGKKDQLKNACQFWRINVWMIAFLALSCVYNLLLYKAIAFGMIQRAVENRPAWLVDCAFPVAATVYLVGCASVTYVLTRIINQQKSEKAERA